MKSILLVDDDIDDQLFFHLVLKDVSSEYHFTNVTNADEMYRRLESSYRPYVIFLDLNLPVKSGPEILEDLKDNPDYKDVPVIAYSTSNEPRLIERIYKAGALHYIVKPNSLSDLDKMLRDILAKDLKSAAQPPFDKFVYAVTAN